MKNGHSVTDRAFTTKTKEAEAPLVYRCPIFPLGEHKEQRTPDPLTYWHAATVKPAGGTVAKAGTPPAPASV